MTAGTALADFWNFLIIKDSVFPELTLDGWLVPFYSVVLPRSLAVKERGSSDCAFSIK